MIAGDRVTQAGYSTQLGGMSPLTLPTDSAKVHEEPTAPGGGGEMEMGNPLLALFAIGAGLFVLWFARRNSEHLQRTVLGINLFNFVTVGLMTVIFIVIGKLAVTRFPVPGLTPLFHAV